MPSDKGSSKSINVSTSDDDERPDKRIVYQLGLATVPLFIVLSAFLIVAARRPKHPYYSNQDLGDDYYAQQEKANTPIPPTWDLVEMLYVFLAFLIAWANLLAYLTLYVPKRRALIGRYLREGQRVLGTVQFNSNAKCCKPINKRWLIWNCSACCGLWRQDYSDLVYTIDNGKGQTIQVKKMVRTYKPWIRERIPILVLPNLPRSGLTKDDVELDVKSQGRNRINEVYYIIAGWIVYLILGSIFLVFQMSKLHDERLNVKQASIILVGTVILAVPLVYLFTFLKYLHYHQWVTSSGTVVKLSTSDIESQPSAYKAPPVS